ncbi:hypothetical protein C2S53_012315 [Perilla frutescens var. hirtella]|uniref:Uncharacterized protein n=1 Tax=Perilla frutescens var. hirtella TaxID=608512 RepID=A0AAD4P1L7_PERFH|nr:hypothetical protein C2S53_012315 [Perilla frutescens var. hirtella]
MAAAYASLVSLSNILHQILNPPPTHHFTIPTEQIQHLQNQVCSIIDFLEKYPNRRIQEIEDLENRIVGAVHKAEDLIESNVVRKILAKKSSAPYRLLVEIGKFLPIQRVLKKNILKEIKKLVSIRRELDDIEDKNGVGNVRRNTTGASSSRSLSGGRSIMVGFDEHLNQMRHVLTSDESTLLIIPIVGMGGIGKTTLATNVYKDPYIIRRFDTCAWVSVSLEYKERDILIAVLQHINSKIDGNEFSDDELGLRLHQELFGRRYLIVLDDMWDVQAWDNLNRFLPNDSNGSRILVTTRLQQLAMNLGSYEPYNISLLDKENSWKLIHEYVFGREECPIEFEEIGRSIARGCGGLPLALAVIGGLLVKSERKRDYWEYVDKNVTSYAKDANDKHCIKILRLSYSELPIHLKPCFLYLAVFPKNIEMRRSRLIRLWVAEGFIKPTGGDSLLEEVAEDYLEDLFHRNLVMINKRGIIGKVKNCSIHDLIRELCMEEVQKNKFLCIAKLDSSNNSPPLESVRRLSIHAGPETEKGGELKEGKHNRSFLNYSVREWRRCVTGKLNLLRVLDVVNSYSMDEIMWLINSRYITCGIPREFHAYSLISLPWNLQTLVFTGPISLPSEFWQMPQLRHLKMPEITLAGPSDDDNVVELKNLQTLSIVKDFIFSKNVVRRIPNLKKLGIDCGTTEIIGSLCLCNLAFLLKLESLVLKCRGTWENMAFPDSLKKLTLSCCQIPWKDMSVVGSLPNLEVLKLRTCAAKGRTWKLNAGEFCQLKFLLIEWCQLEIWEADESNFRCLEHLQLEGVRMEEFPMDFALETLRTIDLRYCSKSLFLSANKMSQDRENSGYEAIQIQSFPKETQLSREDNVVGFADQEATLIKYLNEETDELDVISIVGMPGLGKTTIAWTIYRHPKIQFEFPTLIWVYVSQEFSVRDVFLAILKKYIPQDMSSMNNQELGRLVRSLLKMGKFILFMDDVWTVEDWKQIEAAVPKTNKFGKVLITSRHVSVAAQANPKREPHHLRFLEFDESWELLQLQVFGKIGDCPPELEGLGKQIAMQCGGVPLALVIIGGILAENCADRKELWEKVSHNMNVYENCADRKELWENVISLSYSRLPHDMRDCFLYLGVFPQGTEIPAWKLTRLWIAEEFIQENQGRSLEEVAEDNLNDLVARNLVMVQKTKASGGIKTCRVHGMIREFCQKEGAKKNLFQEVKKIRQWVFDPTISRLCFHFNEMEFLSKEIPKGPNKVRSLLCFSKETINLPTKHFSSILEAFGLLRVIDANSIKFRDFPSRLTKLIHLRYVTLSGDYFEFLPEAVSELWNLQTVKIDTTAREYRIEGDIGKMKELRHLKTKAAIVLKEVGGEVGENLQTLSRLSGSCCTKELFNRASNLKNLGIRGDLVTILDASFLEILERLEKLKLIHDTFPRMLSENALHRLPPPESFPPNLRILTLSSTFLNWAHMTTLGSLPNLEVLKLKEDAFLGIRWEAEGSGFRRLESLHIAHTDLVIWTIAPGDRPFPKLKNLILKDCVRLQQIPSQLWKSLQFVELERVTAPLVESAKKIEAEKQEMQGESGGRRGGFKLIISPEDSPFL